MDNYNHHQATQLTYKQVNGLYPNPIPKLSKCEALKSYKKLIYKFGRKKHSPYSWNMPIGYVRWNKGWWKMLHDTSHFIFRYRKGHKNKFDHCHQQALLEKEMVEFAIQQGWFKGSLKPKVLSKEEKKLKKIENYQKLFKMWEKKQKLASTYLKKYKVKLKRLTN